MGVLVAVIALGVMAGVIWGVWMSFGGIFAGLLMLGFVLIVARGWRMAPGLGRGREVDLEAGAPGEDTQDR